MIIPDHWRPLPLFRVWGIPPDVSETEVLEALQQAVPDAALRSVAFDPKQGTARGQVAFVRLDPPQDPTADVGKVAEALVARLRAAQPALRSAELHIERTGAEVTLYLSNLGDMDDEALRQRCAPYGQLERCFVLRTADGRSKEMGFAEFSVPSAAAACREAVVRAAEAARPRERGAGKAKLQYAEPSPIRSVAGLFPSCVYVVGLLPVS